VAFDFHPAGSIIFPSRHKELERLGFFEISRLVTAQVGIAMER